MRLRFSSILAVAILCLAPTMSWAQLAPYSQDFEGLNQQDPSALANDGWLVFGNVFTPTGGYIFGYGPFVAPNGGAGFSGIDVGQGGPDQGVQQLVVYNDYNNGAAHSVGNLVEANVFQEQIIGAGDVGKTYRFQFDAKRGNIESPTEAIAFIKTLHPQFFFLSRFPTVDMTNVPTTWDTYTIDLEITPDIVGHILQIGFASTTTNFTPSGVFYDNINFDVAPVPVAVDILPEGCPNPLNAKSKGDLPIAILGTVDIDVMTIDPASIRLAGVAPLRSDYEDVGTPFEPLLGKSDCDFDCNDLGADGMTDLTLKFDRTDVVASVGGIADEECVVVPLTGNFFMSAGGGPIEGEDVVLIKFADSGAAVIAPNSTDLNVMPSLPSGFGGF